MSEDKDLDELLADIQSDEHVQEMKQFVQHGDITTYEHCENVARLSYKINKALSLKSNLNTLVSGAMLHDFFLYDWHKKGDGTHSLHGFSHAEKACVNAEKYFGIDEKTRHVIYSHMWPLNLKRVPRSREAWIVCVADKCISLHETVFRRKRRKNNGS